MTNKVQFWHTVVQYLQRGEVLYLSEKTINYGDLSIQAVLYETTIKLGANMVINGHNLEIKQIPQMGHYTHLRNRSLIPLSFYSTWPLINYRPDAISIDSGSNKSRIYGQPCHTGKYSHLAPATLSRFAATMVKISISWPMYRYPNPWCKSHIRVRKRASYLVLE